MERGLRLQPWVECLSHLPLYESQCAKVWNMRQARVSFKPVVPEGNPAILVILLHDAPHHTGEVFVCLAPLWFQQPTANKSGPLRPGFVPCCSHDTSCPVCRTPLVWEDAKGIVPEN